MANDKRFLGVQVDPEFHKLVKIKCAERGLTVNQVVTKALVEYLGLEEEAGELELAQAEGR